MKARLGKNLSLVWQKNDIQTSRLCRYIGVLSCSVAIGDVAQPGETVANHLVVTALGRADHAVGAV